MADPLYQRVCDNLTGMCYDLNTQTGEYRLDPNTGQPISIMDPSSRTTTAQQVQGTAAPSATPVSQDPYTDYEMQRALGVNSVQPTTPLPTYTAPAETADLSTSTGSWNDYYGGYSSSYGSSYGGYSSGGYTQPEPPRYANGQTHPYFGGPALVPGGQFAAQDQGYDNRQQVTSTSGATAGPYAVRAAPAPEGAMTGNYGGGSSGGGGGGGGGGLAKDLYWQYRNKIEGKLSGAAPTGGYEDYKQPRPYRGPDDPRTARKVENIQLQESQKASGYSQPTQFMPGIDLESPTADYLQGLPMTDIALIAGAGKKNWAGGIDPTADIYSAYYKKLNSKLKKGKPGIDFLPFYKKQLRKDKGTEQFNAMLKSTYANLTNGQRLDTNALMGNLTDPAKGTFLHSQQKKTPFSQSSEQFLKSYGALLGTGGYSDNQQNALAMLAQDAVTRYGQQYGQRNPKRAPSVNQYVGEQLKPYMSGTGRTF